MGISRNRTAIGILFLVFLFFIILVGFASFTMKVFKEESDFSSKGKIGVIEINGAILESKKTVKLLHKAEKDKNVKAIILRINSPGGAVGPTQEIYEEIRRIDTDKKGKPVYASFGSIAASGGYYIGAAARRIYASPGTLTGSIGVIMHFTDLSKLYEFAKVSPYPIKSGRYKDVGSPHRPITDEEKTMMKDMIEGVHSQFVRDINKTRSKRLKGDIKEMAQGQIFSGETAHKLGLVDEMAGLWEAGRRIHKELKLDGKFGFKYFKKKKKSSIWDIVDSIEEASTNLKIRSYSNYMPLLITE